jgi:hypothetical protein
VERLKTRIERCLFGNRHRLLMFCHPSRNTLPQPQFEAVNNIRMGILRCPQDEVLAFQHINQTGIALYQPGGEVDQTSEYLVEAICRRQLDANLVQQINM